MPTATLMAPLPERSAWRDVASTYIVCTDDQIIPPAAQRAMAAQASAIVELDSDHSPFLACPSELADVLAGVVSKVEAQRA
jgi:pimeloyl-ACP methyl ester carboxylesterase